MPTDPLGHRFSLSRTDDAAWVIIDSSVASSDDYHVVAHVREEEEAGVTVTWMLPVPLLEVYLTPEAALDDLSLWNRRREGWSRPVPIPHLPPAKIS